MEGTFAFHVTSVWSAAWLAKGNEFAFSPPA